MQTVSKSIFVDLFPAFRDERPEFLEYFLSAAIPKHFKTDDTLYYQGDSCPGIGFLMAGEVRVFKIGENGREITLYEIFPGETCILNASCLLARLYYPANATAATDGMMLFIPDRLFLRFMAESDIMRTLIFSLFSKRFNEIIELVEEVTFGRLSERLTDYLIQKAFNDLLSSSHQKIANDLGTSREVISRLLKDFENKGKVALARNQVKLLSL